MSDLNLIDININPEIIKEHLLLPYCSYIENAIKVESPGNSMVYCSQWFPLIDTIRACFPDQSIEDIKIGLNFVQIEGSIPEGEEMHVHISMLVGIVVEGQGFIIYEKDGEELRESVGVGCMIFVPRNTLHFFEGDPVIKYSAFEFGPLIDYQKHHKILD